jgi:transcriptional regulator of acetoin/glycerol metabolism
LLRDLVARPWLGNVRELRTTPSSDCSCSARARRLAPTRPHRRRRAPSDPFPAQLLALPFQGFPRALAGRRLERAYVAHLLESKRPSGDGGRRAGGLARTYLHRLIKRYDL